MADQYAFIPREAISKFLLYCIDCQRKNSLENPGVGGNGSATNSLNGGPATVGGRPSKISNQQVSLEFNHLRSSKAEGPIKSSKSRRVEQFRV